MLSWDERYSEEGFAYGTEPNTFLAEQAKQIKQNGAVLCLAEGEGRNAVWLAQQGFDVTGVDSSAVGMQKAQQLAKSRGVSIRTVCADLADYSIEPQSWDGIVCIFAHVPPPVRKRLHKETVAGLRKGGVVILEAYRPKQLEYKTGGPPVAELMMQLEETMEEFPGLEWLHAEEVDREIIEGKYHTGKGAVIQLVGRKP